MTDDATALILPVAVVVASACAVVAILVGRRTNPGRDDRWFVAAIVSFMVAAMPLSPFGFAYDLPDMAWAWRIPVAFILLLPPLLLRVVAGQSGRHHDPATRAMLWLGAATVVWLAWMPAMPGPGHSPLPWWYQVVLVAFSVQTVLAVGMSVAMLLQASRGSTGAARTRGQLLACAVLLFGVSYLGFISAPARMELPMSALVLVSGAVFWVAMWSPQHAYAVLARRRPDGYLAIGGLISATDVKAQLPRVLQTVSTEWGVAGMAAIHGDGQVVELVGAMHVKSADRRGTPQVTGGDSRGPITLVAWPTPLTPPLRHGDRERLAVLAQLIELALQREATERQRREAVSTARRADQRMADASESLRAAREVRERAVRSVAHELRSPVNALLGLSDALETRWETLPSGQLEPLQGLVARQVARLAVVVDKLLVVSSIDDGALRSAPERVDVRGLVGSIVSAGIDADIDYRCDDDASDCDVHAEPIALREIVTQLLDNAARHGSAPVEVRVAPAGDQVQVEVLDHGPGIDPSLEPVLFERFTRGAGDGERGLGLGLAIVRELTDSIGGSSGYRRSGTQTSFWIRLPRAAPAAT